MHGRIVAAVDFDLDSRSDSVVDALNERILVLVSSLALSEFSQLHLVHVWDAPAESTVRSWSDNPQEAASHYLESERVRHERPLMILGERLSALIGKDAYDHISPRLHLRRGVAFRAIPEIAKQLGADLLVMGTVARTGISGLFIGNTAEAILEQVQCSVLAVKPPGFISPVSARADPIESV